MEKLSGLFPFGVIRTPILTKIDPCPGSIFGVPHEMPILLVGMILYSLRFTMMCYTCLHDEQFRSYRCSKLMSLHLKAYKSPLKNIKIATFYVPICGNFGIELIRQLLKDTSFHFCQNRPTHAELQSCIPHSGTPCTYVCLRQLVTDRFFQRRNCVISCVPDTFVQ